MFHCSHCSNGQRHWVHQRTALRAISEVRTRCRPLEAWQCQGVMATGDSPGVSGYPGWQISPGLKDGLINYSYPPGNSHIPPYGKRKIIFKMKFLMGYVSSLEGIPLIRLYFSWGVPCMVAPVDWPCWCGKGGEVNKGRSWEGFFSTEKKAEQDVALRICCSRRCPENLISMCIYI